MSKKRRNWSIPVLSAALPVMSQELIDRMEEKAHQDFVEEKKKINWFQMYLNDINRHPWSPHLARGIESGQSSAQLAADTLNYIKHRDPHYIRHWHGDNKRKSRFRSYNYFK